MYLEHSHKIHVSKIHENIIILLLFSPSLYYSLANLYKGFTFLYFLCFVCGAISYVLLIKKPRIFLVTIFLIILVLLYAGVINNQFFTYIFSSVSLIDFSKSKLILLVFLYLPLFVVCLSKKLDYEFILDRMLVCSMIILPLDIIIGAKRIVEYSNAVDYMTIAYQLFFWSMFCIFGIIIKKKLLLLVIVIPAATLIIIGGSRGALLCLVVFLLFIYCKRTFFSPLTKRKDGRKAFNLLLFLFAIIIAINISDILNLATNRLEKYGYSSRALASILSYKFLNNEDRSSLQIYLYPHIIDHVFGAGIFSDRFFIPSGQYAHNLFLELLVDFGFCGVLIILAIIFYTVKAIFLSIKLKDSYMQCMCIYSIVIIYVKFMFSASYLESTESFFAFGLICNMATFMSHRI